jgi:pyrimidine-nucleoside phosphorylase
MRAADLILRKRDGGRLTDKEIESLLSAYTSGEVPDYQMAAMAMAIYFKGLDPGELATWTKAMRDSGQVLRWPPGKPVVDKHSTGGVGDKVSLILGPLAAAAGLRVPMVSGRGLGHTGGTLDKLEAIPGFRVGLSLQEIQDITETCGVVIASQTPDLTPADRKLYALRDVTGTVASIPLIVSSIMSKKLAESPHGLVLDVKVGSGAFMKTRDEARALAQAMVHIGKACGVETRALLTDMDQPLGKTLGNANEVREALATLRGQGPKDLVDLTCALVGEMLHVGALADTPQEGEERARHLLSNGSALARFRQMVQAQGGDVACVDNPNLLPRPYHEEIILSPKEGYIERIDAEALARVAMRLGAGRAKAEDRIDPSVGIELHRKRGDQVDLCDELATLGTRVVNPPREALEEIMKAFKISKTPPPPVPLILERITA